MSKEINVGLRPQEVKVIDFGLLSFALRRREERKKQKGKLRQVLETFRRKK